MKLELGYMTYDERDVGRAFDCFRRGETTMGSEVRRFEAMFAEYVGSKHAVMVNSGSSANLLAVSALVEMGAWPKGIRIKVPALTWATTLWPVIQCGLNVELVDVDRKTMQTPLPSSGSFAVHILGNAAQDEADLEDCCEAFGVQINGHHVGTKALAATFSFYASHHITTVEGGMVITQDDEIADCLRSMRSHGWVRGTSQEGISRNGIDPRFLFIHPGYNLRPMEMQAALGMGQLSKLEGWNARRREVYKEMRKRLEPFGLFDFMDQTPGTKWAPFAFPVLVRKDRNAVCAWLESRGIQTRPILGGNLAAHPAVAAQRMAKSNHLDGGGVVDYVGFMTNADDVHLRGLYWGCNPGVTGDQIDHLVKTVEQYCDQ